MLNSPSARFRIFSINTCSRVFISRHFQGKGLFFFFLLKHLVPSLGNQGLVHTMIDSIDSRQAPEIRCGSFTIVLEREL